MAGEQRQARLPLAIPPQRIGAVELARRLIGAGQMQPGDVLMLYTDGLIDALNSEGEEFGTARLRHTQLKLLAQQAEHVGNAQRPGAMDKMLGLENVMPE